MDKKLTDSEIVKALECCTKGLDCKNCPANPHKGNYGYCTGLLLKDTLDLINHQDEEINRLKAENERLKGIKTNDWLVKGISKEQLQEEKIQAFTEEINRLQEENKEWKRVVETWQELHEKDKAEIERLRKAIEKTDCAYFKKSCELDNLIYDFGLLKQERSVVKAEAYKECIEKAKVELNNHSYDTLHKTVIEYKLDNLLKEMVGDSGETVL